VSCRVSYPRVGLTADLGLCKENIFEVKQQWHTTIQHYHALRPHTPPNRSPPNTRHSPTHCRPARLPPLGCDTSRVTIAPKGDFVAPNGVILAQQCDSVFRTTNPPTTKFAQPYWAVVTRGGGDASPPSHRRASQIHTRTYNITTHNYPHAPPPNMRQL
jgi:hypothetical protein